MKNLANLSPRRGLFGRSRAIRLSPIKEMELRAARLPGVVSLAQGIPSFDTPEPVRAYVREKLGSGETSRYSLAPGLPRLRELIAETLEREGMSYDPQAEILVSCGAIEAISATLLAALEPGDEVIVPSPTYASYPEVIRMAGGVPRFVPLVEEENFDLDPEAIARAVNRRTAAILYGNPNNPTGTVYSRAQIERVAELAEAHDLLVVTDEVYKDFLYNDAELFTPAKIAAMRRRVVRIFSFSKAYGMTGWRVGFLHSDRGNVEEILKIHDALVTCAPVVSQYAAIAALELDPSVVEGFRREFRRRRDLTLGRLDALSHVFDYQKPNSSYFVFPRVKDTVPLARDSRALALDILERARVALVPGVAFGPTGETHLRISYSRASEEIDEAFARLADYFHGRRAHAAGAPAARPGATQPPSSRLRALGVTYLAALSRAVLARRRPRVVAIAGLQGKTVMKRWLREMFEPSLAVRANPRSYNTEVGLPLAIVGAEMRGSGLAAALGAVARATLRALFSRERVDLLILEMGLRRPGDAPALLRAVTPDILIVTPIAPSFAADLSFLGTVEAEVALLGREVAARGGTVLACADDPRVLGAVESVAGVRRFSRDQVREDASGRLTLESGDERFAVGHDVVGDSSFYALLAGIEVARLIGVGGDEVRRFLAGGAAK